MFNNIYDLKSLSLAITDMLSVNEQASMNRRQAPKGLRLKFVENQNATHTFSTINGKKRMNVPIKVYTHEPDGSSRYMPHQGEQEMARRRRQMAVNA